MRATSTPGERQPPVFRWIEIVSVSLYGGLSIYLVAQIVVGALERPPSLLLVIAAAAGAFLAADFASGLVHFLADNVGSERTPVIGQKFILPFRAHHARPGEITEHDFVETNGDSCFVALLVLAPTALWVPVHEGGLAAAFGIFALLLGGWVVLTTQIHKWAHAARPPRIAILAQRLGLALDPREHALHHAGHHDRRYCITSGILNPLLDATGFFRRLHGLLRALGVVDGSEPR